MSRTSIDRSTRPRHAGPVPGGQPSLVDQVHTAVREAIISGSYAPGSRLRLGAIARQNDVSLIPVREAIRRLEAERLVEIEQNKGARVAPVSGEDMLDIYETRIALETSAVRRAAAALDEEALMASSRLLREMARLFATGDDREALACHRAFHFSLYAPCGSPRTLQAIEPLWDAAERYLRQSADQRPTLDAFVAEHLAIVEAIRHEGPEGGARTLEAHLRRTAGLLQRAFGGAAGGDDDLDAAAGPAS